MLSFVVSVRRFAVMLTQFFGWDELRGSVKTKGIVALTTISITLVDFLEYLSI